MTRQKLDVDEQLADNKPLEDVLKARLEEFALAGTLIFGLGQRLHNPFKPEMCRKSR